MSSSPPRDARSRPPTHPRHHRRPVLPRGGWLCIGATIAGLIGAGLSACLR